jgi:predicted negative regulator of RcsB-dependent stress response
MSIFEHIPWPFRTLLCLLAFSVCCSSAAYAQQDSLTKARAYMEAHNFEAAIDIYERLYVTEPGHEVHAEYFDALLAAKQYKDAERLLSSPPPGGIPRAVELVNQGRIQLAQGKQKKAEEYFEEAVTMVNGDEMITIRIANAFEKLQRDDLMIQVYERARAVIGNPYFYSEQLARLYAKQGEIDNAIVTLIVGSPWQQGGLESTKSSLLDILGNDQKKMQQAQKILVKKINEQPGNQSFPEILIWLYTYKDDWEGALLQVQAIDERNREDGQRLMDFARLARREKKYDVAIKALDGVVEKGPERQYYQTAMAERLSVRFEQLKENYAYTAADAQSLSGGYESFLKEVPHYYASETAREYAMLEAQYNNNPQKGIDILQKTIEQPHIRKDLLGQAKLQMGDYHILTGKIWEASLLYSQVDKANKEDMLGEEARFRNARLSYYRSDFKWAQGQLKVLKASTSELIANDALYLSILITENMPDSVTDALSRFAYADLLLFQNKDKEAAALLDSIATAFPKHPLQDDILMAHAKISEKHREYDKAIAFYDKVSNKYGDDVLADDALFRAAQVYELKLKKPDDTKRVYEDLIVRFPGSTYVQVARKKVAELATTAPAVP